MPDPNGHASSQPLSTVDAAWLHMEDPTNLMMVTGLLLFDEPLDERRLRDVLDGRLLRHERFRQRVAEGRLPLRGPRWEPDPAFSLDAHVHRIALPAPHDDRALETLVGDLMSTPLDFSRPLWDMHLIEGVGEGSALLVRLHHCIADGIGLVELMLTLTDGGDARPAHGAGRARPRRGGFLGGVLASVADPGGTVRAARWSAGAALELARITLRKPDAATVLKGDLGRRKCAAWSAPIDLARVKAMGRLTGCTVNDVLMATVTSALRTYLLRRGESVDAGDFHVTIPVNLRPAGAELELGNRFGLVFLALPIHMADPLERLFEVRRRMEALKESPQAPMTLGVLTVLGAAPAQVQRPLIRFFGSKSTAVVTNVPGPRRRLRLAGSTVAGLMFWVPQSGHLGLGVSVMSYAGEVRIGVVSDAHLVAEPGRITAAFVSELDALEEEVRRTAAASIGRTEGPTHE